MPASASMTWGEFKKGVEEALKEQGLTPDQIANVKLFLIDWKPWEKPMVIKEKELGDNVYSIY